MNFWFSSGLDFFGGLRVRFRAPGLEFTLTAWGLLGSVVKVSRLSLFPVIQVFLQPQFKA